MVCIKENVRIAISIMIERLNQIKLIFAELVVLINGNIKMGLEMLKPSQKKQIKHFEKEDSIQEITPTSKEQTIIVGSEEEILQTKDMSELEKTTLMFLNTDMYGNKQMEKFQKDSNFIIKIETNKITNYPTFNFYLTPTIKNFTHSQEILQQVNLQRGSLCSSK